VGRLIRDWSGPRTPGFPDDATVDVYRRAMCIPSTAHCSIEPYRWMVPDPLESVAPTSLRTAAD
jgi:hypothetical protein